MGTRVLVLIIIASAATLLVAGIPQSKKEVLAAVLLLIGMAGCNRFSAPGDTRSGSPKAIDTKAQDVADLGRWRIDL